MINISDKPCQWRNTDTREWGEGVIRFGSGCGGHDLILMVFGSTTTYAVNAVYSIHHHVIKFACDLRQVGGFSTNKTDNITDILLKVTLHIITLTPCNQCLSQLQLWVSEWLLLSGNSAIFQVYHGENKLIFNEMMMRSALYKTNTRSWIFVVFE
jgi:hypothetical protein